MSKIKNIFSFTKIFTKLKKEKNFEIQNLNPGRGVRHVIFWKYNNENGTQPVKVNLVVYENDVLQVKYIKVQYVKVQYNTVQCSTVQFSTVQYSELQYSTVQNNAKYVLQVQYSAEYVMQVQYRNCAASIQYSTVHYSAVHYSAEFVMQKKDAPQAGIVKVQYIDM